VRFWEEEVMFFLPWEIEWGKWSYWVRFVCVWFEGIEGYVGIEGVGKGKEVGVGEEVVSFELRGAEFVLFVLPYRYVLLTVRLFSKSQTHDESQEMSLKMICFVLTF
jgi:hypothetical protein